MDIIQTIVTAFKDFMSGIGTSIVDFFSTAFTTTDGKLSTFAIVSLTFMGLSLALSFVYAIIKMIRR